MRCNGDLWNTWKICGNPEGGMNYCRRGGDAWQDRMRWDRRLSWWWWHCLWWWCEGGCINAVVGDNHGYILLKNFMSCYCNGLWPSTMRLAVWWVADTWDFEGSILPNPIPLCQDSWPHWW
jgi:hypothetical protein